MINHKLRKILSAAIATSLVGTSIPAMDYTQVIAADKNVAKADSADVISEDDEGVFKVTMDETGKLTADNEYAADVDTPFSWDNANVYFVITDRFENGDDSNDHAYERSTTEQGASSYSTRIGTFHGGDLAGMTKKIEEGYFDELGTNAIWITAPYEQIHGALCSTQFKHYAYHGYYTLDYTNVDGNMGTEKDLETFIDTAHSHGIRVIFDIVMNHAGYADAYTANEYGFGKLADNWEEIYYKWDESKYNWYNDYAGEAEAQGSQGMMIASGDWTTNWWGTGWIRAIGERLGGYEGSEGDSNPLTQCLNGLPDFKVETSGDPGIPAILKNKWTKEGNYDEKVAMTKESMSKGGLSASVTGYISAWLSQWVREYGVDGFRCDTAKHVAVSEWSKLKKACVAALNDWREENPDKPGAQWSDDFWMTGEHWDHGVGKDEYYTSGAFDSMINFSYKGIESKTGSGLEGTYSSYAKQINSDPDFNVLSYISSHDTSLGARSASAGTALLLTPGGVQTYYGDESGRTAGAGSGDQPTRSHMNWSSTDKKVLENWQKVGHFRRNHISVGAGQHKQLNASPYTFSRTYTGEATVGAEKKTDYEDKVVVCLPGKAGTYDVSVGDVFEDGETVKDEYSGEEYTVSGGQVSAECDANGVILLAGTGISKPSVGATPGSKSYTTDTLTIKLSASKTESAYYTINGGEQISFENGDTVEIGGDCEIGDSTTIVVGGVGEDGSEIAEKTFTFTKEKEPDYTFYLRIAKDSFKTAPNVFVYGTDAAETAYSAAWPGDTMEEEGDYYVYKSKDYSEARVIFTSNDDTWRYPADMQPGLLVSGYAEYEKDGDVKAFTPSQSGTATKAPTKTAAPTKTTTPTKTTAPTNTPAATKTTSPTKTPAATNTPGATKTTAPTPTTSPSDEDSSDLNIKETAKPTESAGDNSGNDLSGSSTEKLGVQNFLINKSAPQTLGQTLVLAVMGKGGSGNYAYKFMVVDTQTGIVTTLHDYSKEFIANWTPKKAGTYKLYAYVKDLRDGSIKYAIQNYQISKKLSVSKVSVKRLAKLRYKVAVSATGTNPLKYKFVTVSASGKKTVVKNYGKSKTKTVKFKSKGKYIVYVYVKDGSGVTKTVKKTVNVK